MVWPALIAVLGSYVDKKKKQREASQQAYGDMLAQSAQDQGAPMYGVQAARAQNQISNMSGVDAGQLAQVLNEVSKDTERKREIEDEQAERPGLRTVMDYRRNRDGGYGRGGGGGSYA